MTHLDSTENDTDANLVNSKLVSVPNIWDDSSDYELIEDIKKRLGGINKESFEEEILAWSTGFNMLPKYNKDVYLDEMSQMQMSFQSENDFSFETLSALYSTQVSYRSRLTEMKNIVNSHYELYNQAYKSLDKQAFKLFSKAGGSVDDRKADAAHVVAPFLRLSSKAKSLLDQIEEMISSVEFAAFQLSRLLREREALSRINPRIDTEGQHVKNHTGYQSRVRKSPSSNNEDDDGFQRL